MISFIQMPTGLILPEHHAEDLLRQRRRPKGVDFFAGAGGCSLGAIQAGIEVVAAVEWEPYAVMTYMTNLCR